MWARSILGVGRYAQLDAEKEAARRKRSLHSPVRRSSATSGGARRWRQTYPREPDHAAVARSAATLRAAIMSIASKMRPYDGTRQDARVSVLEWMMAHGAHSHTPADGGTAEACIGTPADLMAAMLNTVDEARSLGEHGAAARLTS